jgi:hypothetical protein
MKTEATGSSEMLVDVAPHPKKTAVVFNVISTNSHAGYFTQSLL